MKTVIQIIACGIIYFLVVYLFVIRREARPIVPWSVCITSQVVCAVFFYNIVDFVKGFLPEERFGSLGMVIPSALMCTWNLLLIYIMFGRYMKPPKDDEPERASVNEKFRVAPLPVINAGGEASEAGEDGGVTIAFIEDMIADGRRDEAVKYLKMLAYYGKDDQSRAEAKRMMAELNEAVE